MDGQVLYHKGDEVSIEGIGKFIAKCDLTAKTVIELSGRNKDDPFLCKYLSLT